MTEACKPDEAHLLDEIRRWVPSEEMQTLILEENASSLYGF